MIRIVSVQGEVLIEERNRNYLQMAQAGMTFEDGCDVLIATKETSSATIDVSGAEIRLQPSSYLRVRRSGRSWWDRHGLAAGGDARLWIGRIWAKIGGPTGEPPSANAVVGVRG